MYYLRLYFVFCSILSVFGSCDPDSDTTVNTDDRENVIWGNSMYQNDTSLRPFRVKWSAEEIADLRYRLLHARPPTRSLTRTFEYGFNSDIVKMWVNYWAYGYNFTGRQEYLNQYPQYMTTIQGLDIHFLWVKPECPSNCKVVPLLILHGFPSSVAEYYKLISRLRTQCVNGKAIEVIAASMPGHYYSSPPTRPGCGAPEMATIMKILMNRLGFAKFYIHSNDCVHVDSMIATMYPDSVIGLHTANPITFNPLSWALWIAGAASPTITPLVVAPHFEKRMYPIWEKFTKLMNDLGSIHLLATKPDTIGVALSDSPVGLMAFELTFASWLNHPNNTYLYDGGLFEQFERDVVLDEITAYWFQNCIGTAGRIFAESLNWRVYETGLYAKPTPVPTWAVNTEFNYFYQSPIQLQMKFPNLLGTENCWDTGHYPAYQRPNITANSLFNFVTLVDEWYANNNTICELQNFWHSHA